MNAKAKGSRNERRSIRLLEAAGYACTRAAASLGAWDIIGVPGQLAHWPLRGRTSAEPYYG
jgi:Holliday junction resolvase